MQQTLHHHYLLYVINIDIFKVWTKAIEGCLSGKNPNPPITLSNAIAIDRDKYMHTAMQASLFT